jgi:ribonuclease D
MAVKLHEGDLPQGLDLGACVAVDTETMGLLPGRDRLCLVQLSAGDGDAHIVRLDRTSFRAPRLIALLSNPQVTKLFHFARFDLAVIKHYLGIVCAPIYCTKVASRLARTYTDRHGLKDLCRDVLGIDLSKEQQSSDWGAARLSPEQLDYAASDVLYLHRIRARLDEILVREGRAGLAAACFEFVPARALLDLEGWREIDVFAH